MSNQEYIARFQKILESKLSHRAKIAAWKKLNAARYAALMERGIL